MNKPESLRKKLQPLMEPVEQPDTSFELMSEKFRTQDVDTFERFSFLDAASLTFSLFVHRYSAALLGGFLLTLGFGVWLALSTFGNSQVQTREPFDGDRVAGNVASIPAQQYSMKSISWTIPISHHTKVKNGLGVDTSSRDGLSVIESNAPVDDPPRWAMIGTIEPRLTQPAKPDVARIPRSLNCEPMHVHDSPLDYSGITLSVSYGQSSIPADPAHPEFAATSTSDLNYQAGYRFDRYQEAGVGYSRQTFRHQSSTTMTWQSYNPLTKKTTYVQQTTWQKSDDLIALPGLYYTFHANNLKFVGIEPFATAFASEPSAGFLWRASAGLEWNPWANLNAVITYSREQLNSAAYPAPQNTHNFFDFGLSYQW
jgi:opacity protein-like surface antigen